MDSESGEEEEEEDSLESKLVVRMHCKHGNPHFLPKWLPMSIYGLLRRGQDAQTPATHNRISPPVHG